MSLRIPLSVVRISASSARGRVRYPHRNRQLIPEELVLRRWRDRSTEDSATARGVRFDGCRLPPGTWRLVHNWFQNGLSIDDVGDPAALAKHAERTRNNAERLRAPQVGELAAMLTFLKKRRVLDVVIDRPRDARNPGIPDLFLYCVDRNGNVHDGRFVEVKRNMRKKARGRVSDAQKEELAFLKELGLAAQ
jgi:hypothetical protein